MKTGKKFCDIAPHHRYTHSLNPPNAKWKCKRESCYFVRNHLPVFISSRKKLWWLSWSPWKQHDSRGSWELLFKLICSEEQLTPPPPPQNNLCGFLFSILFGICGCLSVSTATLLMQTECCLRLVHFLLYFFFVGMYNLKPPRWLLYSTATCSVFPMALLCSFSILCIQLSLCIYQWLYFCCGHD